MPDLVIQELTGTGHRVLRRFPTIPFVAIEAAPEARTGWRRPLTLPDSART
jgi:hypothetical protein